MNVHILKSLVSIHDVMPSTMEDVRELLRLCETSDIAKVNLLVVPGLDWQAPQIEQLRAWEADGHELAGHGWRHRCGQIRSWTHRLHSQLLSRDVAEHLSRDSEEIVRLITSCYDWFANHGLTHPQLYVPPAWALGPLSSVAMRELPFQTFESLTRLHVANGKLQLVLPLVGFEADNSLRRIALRMLNQAALIVARGTGRPLRISIHPRDHRLQLAEQLRRFLGLPLHPLLYREFVDSVKCQLNPMGVFNG